VNLLDTCKIPLAINNSIFGQRVFHAEYRIEIYFPHNHVAQKNKNRRFKMIDHQKDQPEQSGKQVAIGIIGFIVGTIVILYVLKMLLF
jgi:hypothetical protein